MIQNLELRINFRGMIRENLFIIYGLELRFYLSNLLKGPIPRGIFSLSDVASAHSAAESPSRPVEKVSAAGVLC